MANLEDSYKAQICEIATAAAASENLWVAASEENAKKAKEVESMDIKEGNYRGMGWNTGTSTESQSSACRRCGCSGSITVKRICAGCRMNGDAYGTYVSVCGHCGLLLWRSYDDA